MGPSAIVQKLWNYCNVLPACAKHSAAGRRDDLLARHLTASDFAQAGTQASGDHPSTKLRTAVEQLTYLLFLKMADERTKPLPDLRHL